MDHYRVVDRQSSIREPVQVTCVPSDVAYTHEEVLVLAYLGFEVHLAYQGVHLVQADESQVLLDVLAGRTYEDQPYAEAFDVLREASQDVAAHLEGHYYFAR